MLGMTYHISSLKRKLIRLGLSDPKEWQTLAVQHGCNHYSVDSDPVEDLGFDVLSNEELGLAMLLGELPYDPQRIRVAAQLLSGEIKVKEVLLIAEREMLESLLNRLAEDILSFGVGRENWQIILESTIAKDFQIGVLPHRSCYVVDQGNFVSEEKRYQILKPSCVVIARNIVTKQFTSSIRTAKF